MLFDIGQFIIISFTINIDELHKRSFQAKHRTQCQ